MISPMCSRSTIKPSRLDQMTATRVRTAIAAACLLLASATETSARARAVSAFDMAPGAVKSAISARFGCSWARLLEADEQCGDELVVLHQGAAGKIEWVELTCPIRPANPASALCRRQADWILHALLPSWPGRSLWTTRLFRAPPRKGQWIKASVGKATVLAQVEGPEDLPVQNVVLGVTVGDPAAWDLPR
ncbi:MAG TPA: hypothetical protein VGM25_04930 [Caulobacteraceae bacterium]